MQHEARNSKKTLIVSDIMQSGIAGHELYSRVAELAQRTGISRIIGIGDEISQHPEAFGGLDARFYPDTEAFLKAGVRFANEAILLKGARKFRFERIAKALQRHSHETVMEVDMDALISNLNYYRSLIKPTTKVMAMVKASAYGAGKVEVASALQYNGADYLTVAYSDEGVELRHAGITLPIMVMNPEAECFEDIKKKYNITSVIINAVSEGYGTVRTQHGILPVPVPAVVNIAKESGLPIRTVNQRGELVTPTGAAFLAAVRTGNKLPETAVIKEVGLGAGKREYELPGFLRAMVMETA